jgi:hypothetical protein
MKHFFIALVLMIPALSIGQTDNTFYVKEFPGLDVGTKISNAALSCSSNIAIPCILIIDPSLAATSPGVTPSLPSYISIEDYRNGALGTQSGGNLTISPGTVTSLSYGSQPTVSLTGTAPNYFLNLGIPQGASGSGSGTVNTCASTGIAYYSTAGTTISCEATIPNTAVTGLGTASTHNVTDFDGAGAANTAQANAIATAIAAIPAASSVTPAMNGTAAVGTSSSWARADHVHPSDTTRVPTTTMVNGHALSSSVTISASDITTGTLPHAQLPALLSGDIPANSANTSGNASTATTANNALAVNGAALPISAPAVGTNGLGEIVALTYTPAQVVAKGTAALGTSSISSGLCATAVSVTGSGITTTDVLGWGFNGDPTSTIGYEPGTTGMLTIIAYPTSGNANFKVCNNTAASITPGAVTLNWYSHR